MGRNRFLGLRTRCLCATIVFALNPVAASAADGLVGYRFANEDGFQLEFLENRGVIIGRLAIVPKKWGKKVPGKGAEIFINGKAKGAGFEGMWKHWTNEAPEIGGKPTYAKLTFKSNDEIEVQTTSPLFASRPSWAPEPHHRWLDEANPAVYHWKRVAGFKIDKGSTLATVEDFTGQILKPAAPGKKNLFDRLDKDGNGCVTPGEIEQAIADPSYQGKDVQAIAVLSKRPDISQANEEKCTDGISKTDIEKLGPLEAARENLQDNLSDVRNRADKSRGALFGPGDSIKPEAVKQGWIGDCNFLSPLSSFANTPEGKDAIRKMISPIGKDQNGVDQYKVIFHDPKDPRKTFDVIVAKPTQGELTSYAQGTENGMWPAVIEKAYGKWRQNHDELGNSTPNTQEPGTPPSLSAGKHNTAETAIPLLTGKKTVAVQVSGVLSSERSDVASLDRELTNAFSGSKKPVMTAGIEDAAESSASVAKKFGKWLYQPKGGVTDGETNAAGLQAGHEFSVLDYNPASKTVKIRNPYGYNNAKDPALSNKDGVFEMNLQEFRQNFSHFTYAK